MPISFVPNKKVRISFELEIPKDFTEDEELDYIHNLMNSLDSLTNENEMVLVKDGVIQRQQYKQYGLHLTTWDYVYDG